MVLAWEDGASLENMAGFLQALRQRLKVVMDVAAGFDELAYVRFKPTRSLTEKRLYPLAEEIEDGLRAILEPLEKVINEETLRAKDYPRIEIAVWDLNRKLAELKTLIENQLLPRLAAEENGMVRTIERADMNRINAQADLMYKVKGKLSLLSGTDSIASYSPYFSADNEEWRQYLEGMDTVYENLRLINEAVLVRPVSGRSVEVLEPLLTKLFETLDDPNAGYALT